MNSNLERHNQTVLVIEGKPYSLVRELNPTSNAVCGKCELAEKCRGPKGRMDLDYMCWPDGLDSSWYFIEDWDIIQTPIVCYCTGDHSIVENTSEQEKRDV